MADEKVQVSHLQCLCDSLAAVLDILNRALTILQILQLISGLKSSFPICSRARTNLLKFCLARINVSECLANLMT